jgi:TfoX/Sxy family transcriptional regulator of competence genes
MPYNEKLADRIREVLTDQKKVEEKTMFRGMCFMVNGKMCICVSGDEIMCRIDPEIYEEAIERDGCRAMVRNGKPIKGYIYVNEDYIKTKKNLDYWINLCLVYNKKAKPAKTRKPK